MSQSPVDLYKTRLREAMSLIEQLRDRLERVEAEKREPVAIVGAACRFPGGADDPEALFRVLRDGTDAVRELRDRWPASLMGTEHPGVRFAATLDDVAGFDAAFFGISPREAESLDPQQRLLLEVSWEALESGGLRPDTLAGSRTGVFVGLTSLDYKRLVAERVGTSPDAYCATGNMLATAAGRLSYALGLQGPAIAIDTACSSSLVAVHLACQSLRRRESDLAIAGGVNLILSPFTMATAAATQALSPDGRCKTFDARANGFVRGEGCGMVALKRLSDALRDGDPILAVIRGTAINQDGRSTGLTAPNVLAQQALLKLALEDARVVADDVGYVETHGTGTSLGDPIELDALAGVLGRPRADGSTCVLGALKTNLGHLEAAAGIAALVKTIQILRHEIIPRNLHFRSLNPRIRLDGTSFVLPIQEVPWPRGPKPRIAGVSSFGISGTNAHVVLEEAPVRPSAPAVSPPRDLFLPLSAKTQRALVEIAERFAARVSSADDAELPDISYTATARRAVHEHRLVSVASSRAHLAGALSAFARGETSPAIVHGIAAPTPPKLVFVFAGQGSQWVGMARKLLDAQPLFRAIVERCDALVRGLVGWSILEELAADEGQSRLDDTEVTQPVLFAIQVGLAELLRSFGATPAAVVGHSCGEIAAAHVAGALSLEDAVRIVTLRGKLLQRASGTGKMTAVALSRARAQELIVGRERTLGIGAVNGPESVVLSGDVASLGEVEEEMLRRGVEHRRVRIDYASHGPQMDDYARELATTLGRVICATPAIPIYSTVTGTRIEAAELDATYFGRNVRASVLFADAIGAAVDDGFRTFVEIGPHAVLARSIDECLAGAEGKQPALVTLRRGRDDQSSLLEALARMYVLGVGLDLDRLHPPPRRVVPLPAYPWQRERFWVRPQAARPSLPPSMGAHPLLGSRVPAEQAPDVRRWESTLSTRAHPYLADHQVRDQAILPATGYLELATAAAGEAFTAGFEIEDIVFDRMMPLGEEERAIAVSLETGGAIEISSRTDGEIAWTRHAHAVVRRLASAPETEWESPAVTRQRCTREIGRDAHYAGLNTRGLSYGPAFRGVDRVLVGDGVAVARVNLPTVAGGREGYRVHPALLDACLQVAIALVELDPESGCVPVGMKRMRLRRRPPSAVDVRVTRVDAPRTSPGTFDVVVVGDDGEPLVEIDGLELRSIGRARDPLAQTGLEVVFRERRGEGSRSEPQAPGRWIVFTDHGSVGSALATVLRARGEQCTELPAPTSREALDEVLRTASGEGPPLKGIVHLSSLDATPTHALSVDALRADLRRCGSSVVQLAQAISRRGFRQVPRLFLVTRGAVATGFEAAAFALSQAPIWGIARTLAMELPDLGCVRIDLSPLSESGAEDALRLSNEMLDPDGEDQIALRGDKRLVARLVRRSIEPASSLHLRDDATYLVTGGLGGLGLELARWMASSGARHLVLMGRSEPSAPVRARIEAMIRDGIDVRVMRGDVGDQAETDRLFAEIRRAMPPLRGVVHAAAVLDDRTLLDLDEPSLLRPFGPKMFGAFNLHEATKGESLDFFVMYSSVASLIGSPGQSNYAGANAFLDLLAHHRRAAGLSATSIQWGPFAEVGLAIARENRVRRTAQLGFRNFTPADGHELLARLLSAGTAAPCEIGLAHFAPTQLIDVYPQLASIPFFSEVREKAHRAGPDLGHLRQTIIALPPAQRRERLERALRELLGRVLGLDPARVGPAQPFANLGLDSLMSLEVKNHLEAMLDVRLQASLLFTYPTVEALAGALLDDFELPSVDLSRSSVAHSAPRPPSVPPGALADDASENALEEKLRELEDYLT